MSSIGDIFKNILALPSFTMVSNGAYDFEVQKNASIHHKSNPYGSRGLVKAF